MTPLSLNERFKVLELVAEIAGEAAQNTNVVWMIEFQEELVEKLYRKMVGLLAEVKTAIPPGEVGQVSLVLKGQRFYPIARSRDGARIEEGTTVKIVQCTGDSVTVERAP